MLNKLIDRMCAEVPERAEALRTAAAACSDHRLAFSRYCVRALPAGPVRDLHARVVAGDPPSCEEWVEDEGEDRVDARSAAAAWAAWAAAWAAGAAWAEWTEGKVAQASDYLVEDGSTWSAEVDNLLAALAPHGNAGRQNALKHGRSESICVRVTPEHREYLTRGPDSMADKVAKLIEEGMNR